MPSYRPNPPYALNIPHSFMVGWYYAYVINLHCGFVTKYIYLLVQYSLFITTLKSKCYYRIILLLRVLVLNITCIYGDI